MSANSRVIIDNKRNVTFATKVAFLTIFIENTQPTDNILLAGRLFKMA